jgi:TRAP-type uncharacterized transport system fused permease subunit
MYCVVISAFILIEFLPDLLRDDYSRTRKFISMLLLAAGVAPNIYMLFNIERIRFLYGTAYMPGDIVFGTMSIVVLLIWVYRRYGIAMPLIAGFFILYVLFGHLLPPDLMGHAPFAYGRFISYSFGDAGLYGSLMSTCTRIIFLYMLFGAFLNSSGVGDYLINAALVVAGRFRGGPAKVAVLSSALLGTINGNSVAKRGDHRSHNHPADEKDGLQARVCRSG